ncbi:MAG: 16S rRNA (cytosine(1402)-N(4))-methyltransferase RsmH [Patescibacteria group bacterium]|nr:16S rRNA (cytosine(1402)-N(4))-methyltransferase RsmH [Patescibacteria group bacterium]
MIPSSVHKPVLLNEVINLLDSKPGEFFIDGTLGGGGHALEIIKRILPGGKFLGVDLDVLAIQRFEKETAGKSGINLVCGNYSDLPNILERKALGRADGIFLDLGMSSDELKSSGRGFSFIPQAYEELLDMRYDPQEGMTAADILNDFREEELVSIFQNYGEERYSKKIARVIVETRKKNKFRKVSDLVQTILSVAPRFRGQRIHPATKIFQALRIVVNRELENLEIILKNSDRVLKSNGRAAIISFHSLEDRLVKNYFKNFVSAGLAAVINKKPIIATREEIKNNPRSRSAKLRVIKFN